MNPVGATGPRSNLYFAPAGRPDDDYSLRQRFLDQQLPTGLWYRSHRTLIRGMARKPGPRKGELCGATAGAGKSNVSLPDTIFRRLVSRWEIP